MVIFTVTALWWANATETVKRCAGNWAILHRPQLIMADHKWSVHCVVDRLLDNNKISSISNNIFYSSSNNNNQQLSIGSRMGRSASEARVGEAEHTSTKATAAMVLGIEIILALVVGSAGVPVTSVGAEVGAVLEQTVVGATVGAESVATVVGLILALELLAGALLMQLRTPAHQVPLAPAPVRKYVMPHFRLPPPPHILIRWPPTRPRLPHCSEHIPDPCPPYRLSRL